jgi:vacuolar-type H+-ATPase subunit F/Vma7
METFTIKDIERCLEEIFESEDKPPIVIVTSNSLYEMYEKELEKTIRKGDFSSYIPPKKKTRRCRR